MITKSKIIEPNAVTVVETIHKMIRKGKSSINFFTKPYIDKLYDYAKYCKKDCQKLWCDDIDKVFGSAHSLSMKELINTIDIIECVGDVMRFYSEGKSKVEIQQLIKALGLNSNRLLSVAKLMLRYSISGVQFYESFLQSNADLKNDDVEILYIYEKINAVSEKDDCKQKVIVNK